MLPPAREDLRRRRWIWQALSDLFLDEETTEFELRHIARVAAECDYSDEDLDTIYRHEVAPAVAFNFYDVAGVCGFFDSEWLEERILQGGPFGHWFDRLIVAPLPVRLVRNHWSRIQTLLVEERERVRALRLELGSEWKPCCAEDAPRFPGQTTEEWLKDCELR